MIALIWLVAGDTAARGGVTVRVSFKHRITVQHCRFATTHSKTDSHCEDEDPLRWFDFLLLHRVILHNAEHNAPAHRGLQSHLSNSVSRYPGLLVSWTWLT